MNDEDKIFEAFRMTNILCEIYDEYEEEMLEKFRKGTRFPYFQRIAYTDDKHNKWVLLRYMLDKKMRSKGYSYTQAYITYDIPRKRKEKDLNAGRGVLIFDPLAMKRRLDGDKTGRLVAVVDIVPHAFNRYTERYLEPLGRGNIEFALKLESMLKRWQWFDIDADRNGDINAQKHADGNLFPYDVIMRGGGMLRGQLTHEMMLRFTTYVSPDMMYDNQIEQHERMRSEYFRLKRENE